MCWHNSLRQKSRRANGLLFIKKKNEGFLEVAESDLTKLIQPFKNIYDESLLTYFIMF
jgi:hypothetical protein